MNTATPIQNKQKAKSKSVHAHNDMHSFTAQELEADFKTNYMGARFYDPDLGRFLQVDPAREFWNSYSYVGNNPVMGTDPTGKSTFDLFITMSSLEKRVLAGAMQWSATNSEYQQWIRDNTDPDNIDKFEQSLFYGTPPVLRAEDPDIVGRMNYSYGVVNLVLLDNRAIDGTSNLAQVVAEGMAYVHEIVHFSGSPTARDKAYRWFDFRYFNKRTQQFEPRRRYQDFGSIMDQEVFGFFPTISAIEFLLNNRTTENIARFPVFYNFVDHLQSITNFEVGKQYKVREAEND